MVTTDCRLNVQEVISWWFRVLDQRVIHVGLNEWRLHITSICVQADEIWIQLADGGHQGGSVLLRVSPDTPVDRAISLLTRCRGALSMSMHPAIVIASSSALRHEHVNTPQPIHDVQRSANGVI